MPMTNSEWAKGIQRSWKALANKATAYADGIIADPVAHELAYAKEVADGVIEHTQDLKAFLESWMEDAQINRGLWVRVPDKIRRTRTTMKDIQRVLQAMHDAADTVSAIRYYTETLYDRVNPESGWRYEPGYFEDEKQWAFLVRGFAHNLKSEVAKASALVAKAVKYASGVDTSDIEHVPNEVDVNGVKVVFLDLDTKSKPTEKTERSPWTRASVVKAMDTARALLDRKGLGFLWYGTMRILPSTASEADMSRYTGLKSTATHAWANYNYRNDTVTVFQSVHEGSVSSAAHTLAHELGHRFWFKFLTETDRAKFADEFGDVEAVSEYGSSNPEEDFAEVFAAYVDGRDLTSDQLERFRSYLNAHKRRKASVLDLDEALDELAAPIRQWIHRPGTDGKAGIAEAYGSLSAAAKSALDADVRRVSPYGFVGYRRPKNGQTRLRGLDSVSTDAPEYMDDYLVYRIQPEHILVHWQQDTPLRTSGFAHEHEVILKPGVDIGPMTVRARQAGGFDGFDLFDDVEDVPETEAQAARREFVENIGYGDIIQVGSRKFRVIKTEGVVKYATLHGTKGRNLYQVIVDGDDPFTVNVFEMVDSQTPSKTVFVSGTPRKVGHVAARSASTLDLVMSARILKPMKTRKIAKVAVAKPLADKLAKRAAAVASGEATSSLADVLARLGTK